MRTRAATVTLLLALLLTGAPAHGFDTNSGKMCDGDQCGQIAVNFKDGVCNPPVDVALMAVFANGPDDGEYEDQGGAMVGVDVEVRKGNGDLILRRTNVTIGKDADGSVDRVIKARGIDWTRRVKIYFAGTARLDWRKDRHFKWAQTVGPFGKGICAG